MRTTFAILTLLTAAPAFALVEPEQSIRNRPLVIDQEELDIYGGFHLQLLTEPDVDLADNIHIPVGATYGLGNNLEVGLQVDINTSDFIMAFTPRARLALGDSKMLAVGLSMTLPLGFVTYHLGPEALPLRLELPAFRYESSAGGVQAVLGWQWAFQRGDDVKGLDANIAGILGIGSSIYALVDVGLTVFHGPDLLTGESAAHTTLAAGIGIGWEITQRIITKFEVFTPDFVEFQDLHFLVLLVHRWQPESQTSPDDWL